MSEDIRICLGSIMDWTALVPFLVVIGGLGTMWGRLDSKIESRVGSVET